MMLAAVKAVTKADAVRESRRHNSDVAAKASARESIHASSPLKSSGRFVGLRMRAANGRRHDLVRNVKVPDRGAPACSELRDELREVIQVLDGLSREPESTRNACEIAVAEHRPVLEHPFGAQLVHLGAVRAVVHHHDQDVESVTLDGFK